MIQRLLISGYVLQNMLQVGFGKTFQNLPYFDQNVAYEQESRYVIKVMSVNMTGDIISKVRENQRKYRSF